MPTSRLERYEGTHIVIEQNRYLWRDVVKRSLFAMLIAVLCTSVTIICLTALEVLPKERFWFELFISAAITMLVTAIVAPIVSWKIFRLIYELDAAKSALKLQAERDCLTKLANRRGLQSKANTLIESAKLAQQPVSMIVLDIDHFKRVNDRYGHQAGDTVICSAAEAMMSVVKKRPEIEIHAGRIGGEEFAIILRGLTRAPLTEFVEQLRKTCQSRRVTFANHRIPFTVSIGSTIAVHDDAQYDGLFMAADQALFRAKETGRNRCTFIECEDAKAAA